MTDENEETIKVDFEDFEDFGVSTEEYSTVNVDKPKEEDDLKAKVKKLKSDLSRSRRRCREAEEDRDVLMSSAPFYIDIFKDSQCILSNQKLPFFIKKGTQKLAKITFKRDGLYISKQEHIKEKLIHVDGNDLIKIKKAFKLEKNSVIHFENKIFQAKQQCSFS